MMKEKWKVGRRHAIFLPLVSFWVKFWQVAQAGRATCSGVGALIFLQR